MGISIFSQIYSTLHVIPCSFGYDLVYMLPFMFKCIWLWTWMITLFLDVKGIRHFTSLCWLKILCSFSSRENHVQVLSDRNYLLIKRHKYFSKYHIMWNSFRVQIVAAGVEPKLQTFLFWSVSYLLEHLTASW